MASGYSVSQNQIELNRLPKDQEWHEIMRNQEKIQEKINQDEDLNEALRRQKYKDELDRLIEAKQNNHHQEKQLDQQLKLKYDTDLKDYQNFQKEKEVLRNQISQSMYNENQMSIEEKQRREQMIKEQDLNFSNQKILQAQRELEEERINKEKQRIEQKASLQDAYVRQQNEKKQIEQQIRDYDQKLLAQRSFGEREEQQRIDLFNKIRNPKINKQVFNVYDNIYADSENKRQQFLNLNLKYMAEKEYQEKMRDQQRDQLSQNRRMELSSVLKNQVQEQQYAKQQQQQQKIKELEIEKLKNEIYQKELMEQKEMQKKIMQQYNNELSTQSRLQFETQKKELGMSPQIYKMNKKQMSNNGFVEPIKSIPGISNNNESKIQKDYINANLHLANEGNFLLQKSKSKSQLDNDIRANHQRSQSFKISNLMNQFYEQRDAPYNRDINKQIYTKKNQEYKSVNDNNVQKVNQYEKPDQYLERLKQSNVNVVVPNFKGLDQQAYNNVSQSSRNDYRNIKSKYTTHGFNIITGIPLYQQ